MKQISHQERHEIGATIYRAFWREANKSAHRQAVIDVAKKMVRRYIATGYWDEGAPVDGAANVAQAITDHAVAEGEVIPVLCGEHGCVRRYDKLADAAIERAVG